MYYIFLSNPGIEQLMMDETQDDSSKLLLTMADLIKGLSEIEPAHQNPEDQLKELMHYGMLDKCIFTADLVLERGGYMMAFSHSNETEHSQSVFGLPRSFELRQEEIRAECPLYIIQQISLPPTPRESSPVFFCLRYRHNKVFRAFCTDPTELGNGWEVNIVVVPVRKEEKARDKNQISIIFEWHFLDQRQKNN